MPLLLLLLLILILFLKNNPELRRIYFIATLAHLLILAAIYIFLNPGPRAAANDGEIYSIHGGLISLVLTESEFSSENFGKKLLHNKLKTIGYPFSFDHGIIPPAKEYGIGYITYIYSIFYAAYGFIPAYIHILNIMLNLITGAIIFKICGILFNGRTAIVALVLVLFNPVSLYYTTTLLKESLYFFAFYLSIYLAILSVQKRNIIYFLLMVSLCLLIHTLKKELLLPFLTVLFIYFIVSLFSKKKLLLIIAPILSVVFLFNYDFINGKWNYLFYYAAKTNKGYFGSAGHNYNLLFWGSNKISLHSGIGNIIYAANGWYHFIFEPILSRNISFGLLAYYPFKVIWVLLCTLALLGIFNSFRYIKLCYRENILLLSFFLIIGSVIALGSGNIGTMLRHRDLVTPVVFIYASYFISRLSLRETHL